MVRAFEALDLTILHQARLALETAGIPFHVEGESRGGTDAMASMSSMMIRVPEDRLADAHEVIREFVDDGQPDPDPRAKR